MTITNVRHELNLYHEAFMLALNYETDELGGILIATELAIGERLPNYNERRSLCILRAAFRLHIVGVILVEA